jgi:hypothetical protein
MDGWMDEFIIFSDEVYRHLQKFGNALCANHFNGYDLYIKRADRNGDNFVS